MRLFAYVYVLKLNLSLHFYHLYFSIKKEYKKDLNFAFRNLCNDVFFCEICRRMDEFTSQENQLFNKIFPYRAYQIINKRGQNAGALVRIYCLALMIMRDQDYRQACSHCAGKMIQMHSDGPHFLQCKCAESFSASNDINIAQGYFVKNST